MEFLSNKYGLGFHATGEQTGVGRTARKRATQTGLGEKIPKTQRNDVLYFGQGLVFGKANHARK